jgi:aspartyl/glutamyl-tRNA(Asn/Gln) amidotransferase C subunit
MSVHPEEVERIAELARLRFEPGEVERLTAELNSILDHMEVLASLSGPASEADAPPQGALASTRGSEEGAPDALGAGPASIAPRWADGFFVVPAPPGVHGGGERGA